MRALDPPLKLQSRPVWLARLGVLVMLACGATSGVAAQDAGAALAQVEEAFRQGDARGLLAMAADRLEIAVLEAPTLYSRAQATYVMQDFFRLHPPERFALREAAQSDGSLFVPGLYWSTSQGEPFQVYVHLRQKAQAWELRGIRIEQRAR